MESISEAIHEGRRFRRARTLHDSGVPLLSTPAIRDQMCTGVLKAAAVNIARAEAALEAAEDAPPPSAGPVPVQDDPEAAPSRRSLSSELRRALQSRASSAASHATASTVADEEGEWGSEVSQRRALANGDLLAATRLFMRRLAVQAVGEAQAMGGSLNAAAVHAAQQRLQGDGSPAAP